MADNEVYSDMDFDSIMLKLIGPKWDGGITLEELRSISNEILVKRYGHTRGNRIIAARKLCTLLLQPPVGVPLSSPSQVAEVVSDYKVQPRESLVALILNTKNYLVSRKTIADGDYSGVQIKPFVVVRTVLECGRNRFILVHNHPSGDPTPSPEDLQLTKEVLRISETMGVACLDHVVIGRKGWRSLRNDHPELKWGDQT